MKSSVMSANNLGNCRIQRGLEAVFCRGYLVG